MALTEPEFRSRCDAAFDKLNRALGVVTEQHDVEDQSTSFKLDWSGSAFVFPATNETLNQLVGRLVGEQLGVAPIPL